MHRCCRCMQEMLQPQRPSASALAYFYQRALIHLSIVLCCQQERFVIRAPQLAEECGRTLLHFFCHSVCHAITELKIGAETNAEASGCVLRGPWRVVLGRVPPVGRQCGTAVLRNPHAQSPRLCSCSLPVHVLLARARAALRTAHVRITAQLHPCPLQ